MIDPKIIVALDFPDPEQALAFAGKCSPNLCRLKVGKELFTAAGPMLVESLIDQGYEVFLDLKYHDIPNTVKNACKAAAKLGVWMLNVHALGGNEMMLAAREGIDMATRRPFLIAVTVLTSMSDNDLTTLGINLPLPDLVNRLAANAMSNGMDGLVCSAREASTLRQQLGDSALLVTPGIRPEWAAKNDQHRIVTPERAMADGASYLVIGRPVTQHTDPLQALSLISESIQHPV